MFIKVRTIDNNTMILNVDNIQYFKPIDKNQCFVYLVDGSGYYLDHNLEDVTTPLFKHIVALDVTKKKRRQSKKE